MLILCGKYMELFLNMQKKTICFDMNFFEFLRDEFIYKQKKAE